MIHVIAIITAKPGQRDEILKNFKANVPAVHAEKGCIEYGATVDTDGGPFAKFGPDTMVVVEKWESMDHLKAHGASEHMKAYGAKNKDLVANRAVHADERDAVICLRGQFDEGWTARLRGAIERDLAAPGPNATNFAEGSSA